MVETSSTQTRRTRAAKPRFAAGRDSAHPVAVAAAFVFAFAVMCAPFPAFADATAMSDVLCTILGIIQGKAGQGLATIGILVIGVAAVLGKASWGMAVTVGVGIATLFGAVHIVYDLGLGLADCSNSGAYYYY